MIVSIVTDGILLLVMPPKACDSSFLFLSRFFRIIIELAEVALRNKHRYTQIYRCYLAIRQSNMFRCSNSFFKDWCRHL